MSYLLKYYSSIPAENKNCIDFCQNIQAPVRIRSRLDCISWSWCSIYAYLFVGQQKISPTVTNWVANDHWNQSIKGVVMQIGK